MKSIYFRMIHKALKWFTNLQSLYHSLSSVTDLICLWLCEVSSQLCSSFLRWYRFQWVRWVSYCKWVSVVGCPAVSLPVNESYGQWLHESCAAFLIQYSSKPKHYRCACTAQSRGRLLSSKCFGESSCVEAGLDNKVSVEHFRPVQCCFSVPQLVSSYS